MKTAQTLLISPLLLVAISHAKPGSHLQFVSSLLSKACQLKYQSCEILQTSDDYCSLVKNAKQCVTTGSVLTNGSIAICTDTEYQRTLDVACMSAKQFGKFVNTSSKLSTECKDVFSNCFGRLDPLLTLKEYCNAFKDVDACLLYGFSVRQSCKPEYEEMKALACTTGAQNIVQNITFLILACVLSIISRDLLVK